MCSYSIPYGVANLFFDNLCYSILRVYTSHRFFWDQHYHIKCNGNDKCMVIAYYFQTLWLVKLVHMLRSIFHRQLLPFHRQQLLTFLWIDQSFFELIDRSMFVCVWCDCDCVTVCDSSVWLECVTWVCDSSVWLCVCDSSVWLECVWLCVWVWWCCMNKLIKDN